VVGVYISVLCSYYFVYIKQAIFYILLKKLFFLFV